MVPFLTRLRAWSALRNEQFQNGKKRKFIFWKEDAYLWFTNIELKVNELSTGRKKIFFYWTQLLDAYYAPGLQKKPDVKKTKHVVKIVDQILMNK